MKFIALGVIASNGSNERLAGQDTYLVSTSDWFAWDGELADHATRFPSAKLALDAAAGCRGPIFRLPDPETVHIVAVNE